MHLCFSGYGIAWAGLLMPPAPVSMDIRDVAHNSQRFVGRQGSSGSEES